MDEDLGGDQQLLLDASTRFVERSHPLADVRAGAFDDPTTADAYWRQAAELGWFSLLVPEALGGGGLSGNGVLDAALVAYRRGQVLQPGPFVGTNVVIHALVAAGSEQQRAEVLPDLVTGLARAAFVVCDRAGDPALDGVAAATPAAGGHRASGTATFVEDPGPGGWLLVVVGTPDGPAQALVSVDDAGVELVAKPSLDLSRRFVEVRLDDVVLSAEAWVGPVGGAGDRIRDELALAATLGVAESVGAMDAELAMTVQYAKDRIAFGRPIGSFQAVKHVLADTSLHLEMSKALALAAAEHVGGGNADGYGPEAASMARAFVGDVGIDLAQSCFQVFGGIGFTWEHDQHRFLRRLTTDALWLGSAAWHREHLCRLSALEEVR